MDADCFTCVFLTHGENGQVSAYDEMINLKDITAFFKGDKCRSLVGKPKIFILQVYYSIILYTHQSIAAVKCSIKSF